MLKGFTKISPPNIIVLFHYFQNRYVANPKATLEGLYRQGGEPVEVVKGKIVAGDAVELQVLDVIPNPFIPLS